MQLLRICLCVAVLCCGCSNAHDVDDEASCPVASEQSDVLADAYGAHCMLYQRDDAPGQGDLCRGLVKWLAGWPTDWPLDTDAGAPPVVEMPWRDLDALYSAHCAEGTAHPVALCAAVNEVIGDSGCL